MISSQLCVHSWMLNCFKLLSTMSEQRVPHLGHRMMPVAGVPGAQGGGNPGQGGALAPGQPGAGGAVGGGAAGANQGGGNEISPLQAFYFAVISQPQPPIMISAVPEDLDKDSVPQGRVDCYGNERKALADMTRFYNNPQLSDIKLKVGFEEFNAHKLVLVRCSEVFERMFSADWSGKNKKEIELVEEPECTEVFPAFLKFLYSCHIVLTIENTLPILMLADKYNVCDLRRVCIEFATNNIMPKLPLKDVFHVWYQYATKCYHQVLITASVKALSPKADDIMSLPDWSGEWLALDRDQLVQFLKSSHLTVRNELLVFRAVIKWIESPMHPERMQKMEDLLKEILPHIRFPMMTPEQLQQLENHRVVEQFPGLFSTPLLHAYKFNALPLESRANNPDFSSTSYLLRNYTDLRWDKRIVLSGYSQFNKLQEVMPRFSTKSSSYPHSSWDWELKIYPKGSSSSNDSASSNFRMILYSNVVLDQPRPIEYIVQVVNDSKVLAVTSGKKNFTKSRYHIDTDIDKKVPLNDLLAPSSEYIVNDELVVQVFLKPLQ
ncbi:BTB/POZ domain-containing protein 17-like isoform X1 [Lytechinus pictus]|uniref:BTB/POZ domain-containing protein 17-like isoform X1 n=1 Tax=Lytechinus pictus TaxID=7653 RepID=UPI0030B9E4DE